MIKKSFTVFLLSAACLQGCSEPRIPLAPGLSYLQKDTIKLNVAQIEVAKKYVAPGRAPHVDHQFAMPPSALIQQWIRDHIVPSGAMGQAIITIEDASVVETALPSTPGFKGLFTIDQSDRYDAKATVKVDIIDGNGMSVGYARAEVSVSKTVNENMNLHQRQKVWSVMMEELLNRLNGEIERNINEHLQGYLVP